MASESSLSYETFLELAGSAGINTRLESGPEADPEANQEHLQQLYAFLQPVLDSLKTLEHIDVSQDEPDMSFMVPRN